MTPAYSRVAVTLLGFALFANIATAAEEFAVFKSRDRGRTWFRSDTGMPDGSRINAFGSLDETLFVGTDSGIFVSGDEARSWHPATGVAGSSGRVISFATLGRRIFAGTDGSGVLVSSDTGQSWGLSAAFPSRKVRCLVAHEGVLYAGTDAEGVLASHDDGQVWIALSCGLPVHAQVFALAVVEGRLFAGLYSRGLYAWDGQEQHWMKTGDVSPLALAAIDGTLVAGHNPGGIYWSEDMGATWSRGRAVAVDQFASVLADDSGELSTEAPVWGLASNDELVFAGAAAGIYYSEDRGRSWTRARKGLPAESPGISFLVTRAFVLAGIRELSAGVEVER